MTIKLTEEQLRHVVMLESCGVLRENGAGRFDNISDEELAQYGDNYYEVTIPEWAIPGLLYDYYEGLTDWQVMDIKGFKRHFQNGALKLPQGMTIEDILKPMPGRKPVMCPKNDIGVAKERGEGSLCYKMAIPTV